MLPNNNLSCNWGEDELIPSAMDGLEIISWGLGLNLQRYLLVLERS